MVAEPIGFELDVKSRQTDWQQRVNHISNILGAHEARKRENNGRKKLITDQKQQFTSKEKTYGIRHGSVLCKGDCMYFKLCLPGSTTKPYVQVDVEVCRDPKLFDWQLFCLRYKSMSKILGSMSKQVDLTLNNKGLHLRIPELANTSFAEKVLITNDPGEALKIFELNNTTALGTQEDSESQNLYSAVSQLTRESQKLCHQLTLVHGVTLCRSISQT